MDELKPSEDLRQRCSDILDWRQTGSLPSGAALRAFAEQPRFDRHESDRLRAAEDATLHEAATLIATWNTRAASGGDLTARQLAAVVAAMENAEHDAGDFDEEDEDQANARNLYDGLRNLLAPKPLASPSYPKDDVEAAVFVLKVLHQGSAEACAKDGRDELSNVHLDAVTFLDYALELHRASSASGGDSASLEQRGRAGVSLASLASIEALIVDAYRDGMQMRSFDMVAARNAIAAALANQQGVGAGTDEANRLLREVVDNLEGVGCGPCIGSHAPFEDLHGRIERYLATQPAGDVGSSP